VFVLLLVVAFVAACADHPRSQRDCVAITPSLCSPASDYVLRVRNDSHDQATVRAFEGARATDVAAGADILVDTNPHPAGPWQVTVMQRGVTAATLTVRAPDGLVQLGTTTNRVQLVTIEIDNSGVTSCPPSCGAA